MSNSLEVREAFAINVADVSGQNVVKAAGLSPGATIGELVQGLIPKMNLPVVDPEGRKISYHVRLDKAGRHLHPTEIVGDVLEEDDQITLQPNIMAG
jgi:hypothetical protein